MTSRLGTGKWLTIFLQCRPSFPTRGWWSGRKEASRQMTTSKSQQILWWRVPPLGPGYWSLSEDVSAPCGRLWGVSSGILIATKHAISSTHIRALLSFWVLFSFTLHIDSDAWKSLFVYIYKKAGLTYKVVWKTNPNHRIFQEIISWL